MALRFRKSITLAPGTRLNLGGSFSFGGRGVSVTVGNRGTFLDFGVDRDLWSGINFQNLKNIDVVDALTRFELRRYSFDDFDLQLLEPEIHGMLLRDPIGFEPGELRHHLRQEVKARSGKKTVYGEIRSRS